MRSSATRAKTSSSVRPAAGACWSTANRSTAATPSKAATASKSAGHSFSSVSALRQRKVRRHPYDGTRFHDVAVALALLWLTGCVATRERQVYMEPASIQTLEYYP